MEAYYKLAHSGAQITKSYSEWNQAYLLGYLGATATTITDILGLNLQKALRVFIGSTVADAYKTNTLPIQFVNRFSKFNLSINDQRLFSRDLDMVKELYDETMKASKCGALTISGKKDSIITLKDAYEFYRFVCVDISHLQSALPNDNSTVTIRMEATCPAMTRDNFYMIETEKKVVIKLNENSFSVVLGL
jgi:hypothetical protein